VELIVTTPRRGRFFRQAGRPFTTGSPVPPPTTADLERFLRIATEYGYWNATPEENAAVGIDVQRVMRHAR